LSTNNHRNSFPTNANPSYHNIREESESWSTNYTIDRLKEYLAKIKYYETTNGTKIVEIRKYYNQAFHMLKVGAFKPIPSFLIYLTDFDNDPRLLKELHDLDKETLTFVLLQAVERIFEDLN
jgi:hypothetical protein